MPTRGGLPIWILGGPMCIGLPSTQQRAIVDNDDYWIDVCVCTIGTLEKNRKKTVTNDACSAVRCVSHFNNGIYLYSTQS